MALGKQFKEAQVFWHFTQGEPYNCSWVIGYRRTKFRWITHPENPWICGTSLSKWSVGCSYHLSRRLQSYLAVGRECKCGSLCTWSGVYKCGDECSLDRLCRRNSPGSREVTIRLDTKQKLVFLLESWIHRLIVSLLGLAAVWVIALIGLVVTPVNEICYITNWTCVNEDATTHTKCLPISRYNERKEKESTYWACLYDKRFIVVGSSWRRRAYRSRKSWPARLTLYHSQCQSVIVNKETEVEPERQQVCIWKINDYQPTWGIENTQLDLLNFCYQLIRIHKWKERINEKSESEKRMIASAKSMGSSMINLLLQNPVRWNLWGGISDLARSWKIVMKVGSLKSHLFFFSATVRWTVRTRWANDGSSFKIYFIFILLLVPDA